MTTRNEERVELIARLVTYTSNYKTFGQFIVYNDGEDRWVSTLKTWLDAIGDVSEQIANDGWEPDAPGSHLYTEACGLSHEHLLWSYVAGPTDISYLKEQTGECFREIAEELGLSCASS